MDIDLLDRPKLITCIVPSGLGLGLEDGLFHELGIPAVNVARGRGASQRSGQIADEMDILSVVVPPERADEVFRYLYDKAEIAVAPHRFMYQSALNAASLFTLPEALEEEGD